MVNVEMHLGLVHHLAKKFYKSCEELCEYEDLISAGYIGLCKSAIKFDESRGFKFSTFAGKVIISEMTRLIMNDKSNFKRTKDGYERVYIESLNEVISETSEKPTEKIHQLKDYSNNYLDVDMKVTFERFDDRERKILDLYFNKNLTQKEIAEVFNLSQTQISRKLRQCLNVLKEAI